MIVVERAALAAPLQPFVERLWITGGAPAGGNLPAREYVLPTGAMHLVFRLSDDPVRLFDRPDADVPRTLGCAVIGGARAVFYARETSVRGRTVGAQLRPGAGPALFGMPAGALAGRHTAVDAVWGGAATERIRERLAAVPTPGAALALFQSLLVARLPTVRGIHPAIAQALAGLAAARRVDAVARDSGYSHRHFVALFRDAVGLTPKVFARVTRFQKAVVLLSSAPALPGAAVAADCGYCDQAHLDRDFGGFAGITPEAYRALAPAEPNHVPVGRTVAQNRRGQIRPRRVRVDARRSLSIAD